MPSPMHGRLVARSHTTNPRIPLAKRAFKTGQPSQLNHQGYLLPRWAAVQVPPASADEMPVAPRGVRTFDLAIVLIVSRRAEDVPKVQNFTGE